MQNRFFAMLARMKLIRRWGLMFSTRDENLSEHSLDTAFFMHAPPRRWKDPQSHISFGRKA